MKKGGEECLVGLCNSAVFAKPRFWRVSGAWRSRREGGKGFSDFDGVKNGIFWSVI